MITRIVRLSIKAEKVDEFKIFFRKSYSAIGSFKGCTHLEFYHDVDFPNVMITYSKWNSVEDLDNYRKSELFKTTWAFVKPMFDNSPFAFSMEEEKYKHDLF